ILRPDLPAAAVERLADGAADSEHRSPRFLGERRPVRLRRAEHERAGRRVDVLAVDLEARTTAENDVELLVAWILGMSRHEPVANIRRGPGVRAERGDPKVVA